jgi:competence protein ComGC
VIFEFGDCFLVVIVLFVLFVYVVDCYTDDVDHVAEEGCAAYLEDHCDDNL